MDTSAFLLYDSNMKRPASPAIKVYDLFGESGGLPDIVHCETIAARSVRHGWTFAPHRHARLHQVLMIEHGGGQASLDGRAYALRPLSLVNLPVNHVHGFSFKPGTQGWVLTIAAEMLDQILLDPGEFKDVLAQSAVLPGTRTIRGLMRQIFIEHGEHRSARAHMLRSLSAALFGLIARQITERSSAPRGGADHGLFRRFEQLVEQHYRTPWTVARYARTLSITPAHLSRVCRAATGQPASRLILNRLIREARRNLVYTNLSVSTIAYELGFRDPAYFSRVYSSATGSSPRAFRAQMQAGGH